MSVQELKHGGNLRSMAERAGCAPSEILDFSANINPLGFPEWLRPLISSQISGLVHYPDPHYQSIRSRIARHYGVPSDQIVLGNGSSEILFALPHALKLDRVIVPVPCYSDYLKSAEVMGVAVETLPLLESEDFALSVSRLERALAAALASDSGRTAVILGNPNNPTGRTIDAASVRELARKFPSSTFVIDEAFIDFTDANASLRKDRSKNVVILHSMTKILAVPGLRMGFAIAEEDLASRLQRQIPPWSLNSLSAAVWERALEDAEYFAQSREKVTAWRAELTESLRAIGAFKIYPGKANFLLLKIEREGLSARELSDRLLLEHRIGIRNCDNYLGLDSRFVRIAVRTPEENARLVQAFERVLNPAKKSALKPRRTPALMLQGTGSNVGKSILTTALCRILYQDGVKVAPFKSQNMALNSFVTPDGGEIGRAQALQAQACKKLPDTRMNPVLLKPSNESGSQVIVCGKPVAHMDFKDYHAYKAAAFDAVKRSYDSLSAENEVMLIEGAGSASEVNLKKNDIVNMRMAQYANARVLLVGNIDHGGVFGAFVGTMETLSEWERDLVAGFVINRFRGVKELLHDGLKYVHAATGKPFFGVVPHLKSLHLPEEDSLEFKSGVLSDESPLGDRIDVAVLDTPRISNFTDFDALRIEADVRVRFVRALSELGNPDVIILPGSKNVVTDLQHLKEIGLAQRVIEAARSGKTEVVGICGGYQMLGARLLDPHHLETEHDAYEGFGLLPLETTLEQEKILSQTRGTHLDSGEQVLGYEIHHGQTRALGALPISVRAENGSALGHQDEDGRIWGTYLHGVFDEDTFRRWFLDRVRTRKGLQKVGKVQKAYTLEASLDRLADSVRESLDMKEVYRCLGL